MTLERRKSDQNHTTLMLAVNTLTVKFEECVAPAIEQVWTNKAKIQSLEDKAENTKDGRGRLVSYVSIVISVVIATMLGIKNFFHP